MTTKYCSAALLLALAALRPLGCQGNGSASSSRADARNAEMMKMPAAMNDGEFASMMVMHHKGAIEMGRYEAQDGTRTEVRDLAGTMADSQSAENVNLMDVVRETGHGNMKADPPVQENMGRCMTALRSAGGVQVDSVFLTHMIKHHTMGVDMARKAMPNLKRNDTRLMAKTMIDDQTREIAQRRGMVN